MEKLARAPPPHPSQVKMVSSPNVPTDNLDSQGSVLPSYSKELEEYCQFSVADEVNAIVYIGFACFEIYSRPNSPRSSSLRSMAVLSSRAHERRSGEIHARSARERAAKPREKTLGYGPTQKSPPSVQAVFQVAPAPISSRFLCPRRPLLLSAPNQNRHATQANVRVKF